MLPTTQMGNNPRSDCAPFSKRLTPWDDRVPLSFIPPPWHLVSKLYG